MECSGALDNPVRPAGELFPEHNKPYFAWFLELSDLWEERFELKGVRIV